MAWLRHILWLATNVTIAWMACLPSELLFKSRCLRSCPKDTFISQQKCVDKCPPNTEQLDTEMSKILNHEMDSPHINVLMQNDSLTENVTENNTECLLKEDAVAEIDDGYTIHNQ
ncbi:uncharacterized protein LOC143057876 [Mytilus galloprovincialis]|uniref:uncharacterized protein LOC143057876 n=1 Tax=Mytilus galloprovincialis TaxID=29158 RepID=UPI003F7C339D